MNEIKKKDTGMLIGDKYLLSIKEADERNQKERYRYADR